MYYEEEFFLAEDSRRRRPDRDVALECACNVLGENNQNPGCGCGGQDPERTEKHVYHHIVEDRHSCKDPISDKHCSKSCACNQLKNLAMNTEVDIFLEGTSTPITGVFFISFDPHTGCATFTQAGGPGTPPVPPVGTLVVDCKKIAALLYR